MFNVNLVGATLPHPTHPESSLPDAEQLLLGKGGCKNLPCSILEGNSCSPTPSLSQQRGFCWGMTAAGPSPEAPSPVAAQSTVRHLIAPVPTISKRGFMPRGVTSGETLITRLY